MAGLKTLMLMAQGCMSNLWVDPKTFNQTCRIYRDRRPEYVTLAQHRERAELARQEQGCHKCNEGIHQNRG